MNDEYIPIYGEGPDDWTLESEDGFIKLVVFGNLCTISHQIKMSVFEADELINRLNKMIYLQLTNKNLQ